MDGTPRPLNVVTNSLAALFSILVLETGPEGMELKD